jgi:hypothetical protein
MWGPGQTSLCGAPLRFLDAQKINKQINKIKGKEEGKLITYKFNGAGAKLYSY